MPSRAHPDHPDIDAGMWEAVDRDVHGGVNVEQVIEIPDRYQ